jgi:SPP1 gp7 family putative phage head morphogenesis protein
VRRARPVQPTGIQLTYYAELRAILRYARELVRARVYPRLAGWRDPMHGDAGERVDAPPRGVNRVLQQIAEAVARKYPLARLERLVGKIAAATGTHQRSQLQRQLEGIDLGKIVDRGLKPQVQHFVAENVALIRTLPADYFQDVEREVLRGVRAGDRASEIQAALEERADVAQNRAALIARDQVLSFQADLNRTRQENLGVSEYIWRATPDERTRPEHAERDGQTFSWDDPPGDPNDEHTGGHPGEAINCRCNAEPIIPEDLLS